MAKPITEQDRSKVRDVLARLTTEIENHRGRQPNEQHIRKWVADWEEKRFQSCRESRAEYEDKYNTKRQALEAKLKEDPASAAAQQPQCPPTQAQPVQAQPPMRPAPQQVLPEPMPSKPVPPQQALPKPTPLPQQPPMPAQAQAQPQIRPAPQKVLPQQVLPKPTPPQQLPSKPMPPPQQPQTRTLPAPAPVPINPKETSLLARTAMLVSKDDDEQAKTLVLLCQTLDPSDPQANKIRSQEVLDNKAVMGVLLYVSATTRSADVEAYALWVLLRLAWDGDNKGRLLREHPSVVPALMRKLDFRATEQAQTNALVVLATLAADVDNAREMITKNPTLLPLLVAKMSGSTASLATRVVYNLSCCLANRAILQGNNWVVAALTTGKENKDTSFVSLLALVNLFGAEEDSEVLKTDLSTLQRIASAMNKGGARLDEPLLAFRYLCAVEHNRQLLWSEYNSEFLTTILAALQRAIGDKNAPAAENAVSMLAQFSSDPEPLAWMRSNKPQLDEVFAQLALFPGAQRTAQLLLLALNPPKASPKRVLSDDAPAKRQQVAFSKSRIPQNEQEIREWLSTCEHGKEIAKRLVKEDLVEAKDLERLSAMNPAELKRFLEVSCKQALKLEAALRELF